MRFLLSTARAIDFVNDRAGSAANWLVLAACLISAGHAMTRYAFDLASNGWLDAAKYLFAALVMLGASHTLRRNEHVRVDILYTMLSARGKLWLDLIGTAVFLVPSMLVIAWYSWPFFMQSWSIAEGSANAGGLAQYPAKILLPLGFTLVALQGVSEIIKRAASLHGDASYTAHYERPLQ
ncbi:TRAP transporter small permease subunit [Usitatibacter palustris]|uniref:TRAP transporter small permease protein n=1 Tax=Usitatibacter palustris TaxID=2732487 RepID=A0A6M4H5X8_9PROT|nr:TRAP transporter small permease subunit [Usitatibacter palustris]QJR14712.1 hypothetical protein DSM104440_01522 [Usitatibacter palustris]